MSNPPRPDRHSRSFPGLGAATLAAVFLLATAAIADEPEKLVLFDGKSLDGWKATDFYKAGAVEVRDGTILVNASAASGGMTGITSTRRNLPTTDYELSYEAMRVKGQDFFAAATFPVGESFITLVNGGWGGGITGLSSIDGVDASENETNHFVKYRNGTWYRFRIRVTAEVIRCWIDDEPVASVRHRDRLIGTRIETRASQPLGFATWETTGALRHITLRRLSPSEVATTNEPD